MDTYNWYNKWQNDNCFLIENDCLREKSSIFSSIPKADIYGFQDGSVRELLLADIVSRYERMKNKNVLFPVGFNTLSNKSFLENKKQQNEITDDISNIFLKQMLELGLSVNKNKCIDLRHDEYLANLQLFFIDLYNKGYIKYDYLDVYYDSNNNKIYDDLTKIDDLPKARKKVFYLEINTIINELVNDIKKLNVIDEIKTKLFKYLGEEKKLKVNFYYDYNNYFTISLSNPEYLAGISYILINPNYLTGDFDLNEILSIQELNYLTLFFEDRINFFFSGCSCKNPLTMQDIPIFISNQYEEELHIGIPDVYEDDLNFARKYDISVNKIIDDNGLLINSDLLTGLDVNKANKTIFEAFLNEGLADVIYEYKLDKILLSSSDTFGALFPFLIDDDFKLYSLENNIPYTFSKQFRPLFKDNVDIPGRMIDGSINNLFTMGSYIFISILYDELAINDSIFSKYSKEEFKRWLPSSFVAVKKENILSELFMPLVLYDIIKKEYNCDMPDLFSNILICDNVVDQYNLPIERKNNNLIDFTELLKKYNPDSIRFYFMLKNTNDKFIFNYDELKELDEFISVLKTSLLNKVVDINPDFDFELDDFIKKCDNILKKCDIHEYAKEIYIFSKKHINTSKTKKQILRYLTTIYSLFPYLSDDIYLSLYNSKYSIINEGWIE